MSAMMMRRSLDDKVDEREGEKDAKGWHCWEEVLGRKEMRAQRKNCQKNAMMTTMTIRT